MIRLIYSDIAVGSREAFEPTADGAGAISHIDEIRRAEIVYPNLSTVGELNQTLLDGAMNLVPDNTENIEIGLWSNALSGEDGTFAAPLSLTMEATNLYTSQGITISTGDAYPRSVNIKWYRDGTLLADEDFVPNESSYFCERRVDSYNRVVMTFGALSLPCQRLKIRGVVHGRIREFDGYSLSDVSIIQECSPISAEMAINTMDFTLRGDTDINYVFQSRQSLEIYNNSNMLGVFFVKSYTVDDSQSRSRFYHVKSEDHFGLLDQITFAGGIFENRNAAELLSAIFSAAYVPFEMDESIAHETVSGWIPICTCREAVLQICFAIGAAADTTMSRKVRVWKPSAEIAHAFSLREIMQGQEITDRDKKLTEVRITVHGFAPGGQSETVYSADKSGTGSDIYVEFGEPMYNLQITSGTIVESGANHAIINANAGCVLTGTKYSHTTAIRRRRNPLVNIGDPENVVEVKDMTLITSANAETRLDALYEYYMVQGHIKSDLVMLRTNGIVTARPGDRVEIATVKDGTQAAWLESMRYKLYGGAIVAQTSAR